MWTTEQIREVAEILEVEGLISSDGAENHTGISKAMTRAVDLAEARGGTMTADAIADRMSEVPSQDWVDEVMAHISAQGARVAVLEAKCREESKRAADALARMAVLEKELELARKGFDLGSPADATIRMLEGERDDLKDRLSDAEESVRELTRKAQQAEGERDRWQREHAAMVIQAKDAREAKRQAEAQRDSLKKELARRERGYRIGYDLITSRCASLEDRCATLSVAGQVLSEHVDKVDTARESEAYGLLKTGDDARYPQRHPHVFVPNEYGTCTARVVGGHGMCGYAESQHLWPCSATCTHDDARTPGHPERVKERSEAFKEVGAFVGETLGARRALCDAMERLGFDGAVMFRDTSIDMAGLSNALFQSVKDEEERVATGAAEAMRAACLEAAMDWVQRTFGHGYIRRDHLDGLKSAIEGATP